MVGFWVVVVGAALVVVDCARSRALSVVVVVVPPQPVIMVLNANIERTTKAHLLHLLTVTIPRNNRSPKHLHRTYYPGGSELNVRLADSNKDFKATELKLKGGDYKRSDFRHTECFILKDLKSDD